LEVSNFELMNDAHHLTKIAEWLMCVCNSLFNQGGVLFFCFFFFLMGYY